MRPLALLRRWAARRDGAAALEFALVLPALITFLMGVWYVGWAINLGSEVRHAVELGSRIYISNPTATSTDLSTAVSNHLTDVAIGDVTLNSSQVAHGTATSQHITWSYATTATIPFLSAISFNFSGAVDVPLATS